MKSAELLLRVGFEIVADFYGKLPDVVEVSAQDVVNQVKFHLPVTMNQQIPESHHRRETLSKSGIGENADTKKRGRSLQILLWTGKIESSDDLV